MAQLHVSSWFAGKQQLLSRAMLGSVERETEKAVLFKGTALLQPSDVCLRCGREITHPVSLHYGYGPDCAEHIGIPNAHLRDDADVVAGLAAAQAALVESRTVEFWVPKSQIEKLDYSTEEIEALEKGKLAAKEKVSIKVFDDIIRVDNLPYDDRHLARLAGCRWNGDDKYWWIEATPANAVQIANAFEGYGSIRINAAYRSLRAEGEFDVDNIDGLVTPLWPHQKEALRFIYDKPGVMLAHDMGPQPYHSLVLTPSGWREMGELAVGDEVIGSSGAPVRIGGIREYDSLPLWRIVTADGAKVECSPLHRWTVKSQNGQWVTVSTERIAESLLNGSKWDRLDKLPRLSPIVHEVADLPLDPYVLGVLLANGSMTTGMLRFRATPEIAAEIRRRGYQVSENADGEGTHPYYNITGLSPNTLIAELGIGVAASEKRVPGAYMRAAAEQRLDLLRGLMDCDGTKASRSACYSTVSFELAMNVSELARMHGGGGSMRRNDTRTTKGGHTEYIVTLGMPADINPFLVYAGAGERKQDNLRRIVRVETAWQEQPMRCLEIESDDHLYVTDGYVLTHNCGKSLTAIATVVARKHITTLVLCPKRVINTLADQVRMHAPDAIVPVPLAKGSVAKKTNIAKQAYEYARRTNTPTMIIINYESAWREPFATWSKSDDVKWDFFIADECHRLKSPGGKQSRYAQVIGRKASYRLGMTGTPMPNNPLDIYAQYRAINDRIFGTRFAAFRLRYAEVTERFGFPLILGYRNQEELRDKFFSIAHMVHASDVLALPDFQNINVPVELSATERKHYKEMEALLWTELGLDPKKIDHDEFWDNVIEGNESTATNPLVKNLRLQQITGGHIKDDEGVVSRFGDSKAKALKEILEDVGAVRENEHDRAVAKLFGQAESPEPVVVFALFHQDLEAIKKVCEEVGLRYGEISGRVNEDDYDAWKRGEVDVMAVQIASGGEGLNDLVRARICIYYSLGYSLKDFLQSRRRVLRPGQKNNVIYYYLAAEGTVDERVYAKLQAKQDTVEGLLGKKMG